MSIRYIQIFRKQISFEVSSWVSQYDVIMPWLNGWGCQPLQTASPSILYIYKVFHHTDMLFISIWWEPYTVIATLFVVSDFGVLGLLGSQNDANMSWLRLTATSNCFPHPYWTYTQCLSTFICCPLACSSSLAQLYPSYLAQILRFWFCVTCSVKMMSLCHGWSWQPLKLLHISILDIQCVWAH